MFHFPRITATGIYRSPTLLLTGNRVRYVQTISGTTPSFTRAISRLQSQQNVQSVITQLLDRTISLTTLNSTTPALRVQNSKNLFLEISIGAATTPPTIQLQGSSDNVNWYDIGLSLNAVASSTVTTTIQQINANFIRARVSSAGSGVTSNYVLLRGF